MPLLSNNAGYVLVLSCCELLSKAKFVTGGKRRKFSPQTWIKELLLLVILPQLNNEIILWPVEVFFSHN